MDTHTAIAIGAAAGAAGAGVVAGGVKALGGAINNINNNIFERGEGPPIPPPGLLEGLLEDNDGAQAEPDAGDAAALRVLGDIASNTAGAAGSLANLDHHGSTTGSIQVADHKATNIASKTLTEDKKNTKEVKHSGMGINALLKAAGKVAGKAGKVAGEGVRSGTLWINQGKLNALNKELIERAKETGYINKDASKTEIAEYFKNMKSSAIAKNIETQDFGSFQTKVGEGIRTLSMWEAKFYNLLDDLVREGYSYKGRMQRHKWESKNPNWSTKEQPPTPQELSDLTDLLRGKPNLSGKQPPPLPRLPGQPPPLPHT